MANAIIDDSKELLEAQAHIWNHTFNYMTTMALRCAVQLGMPDVISDHDKPVTLSELVTRLSIPPTKTNQFIRLMKLLVHTRFFIVKKDDLGRELGYVGTYSSKLLSEKQPGNIVPFVMLSTGHMQVPPCMILADWFRGPDPTPFVTVHGATTYDYGKTHPEHAKLFNEAMACHSELTVKLLIKDLKPMLEGVESLVDVGGGDGTVAKAISQAFPHLKCSVYDLPHVVSGMEDLKKVKFVGGNMFESVPSADVILIKDVLLDWTDPECSKLLKRCREALSKQNGGGKVIIVDAMKTVQKGDSEAIKARLCFDLFTATCTTGAERTEAEWKKLFLDAGFTTFKITSAQSLSSIIEVFP